MINLQHVYKIYKLGNNDVYALNDISLEIKQHEFVSIIGPSGSGKSTLMHILGCLDVPTKGKYFLDDIDVSLKDDQELAYIRNKKIGFVFQGFNLLPKLTAIENVELPLIYSNISQKERTQKAIEALSKVGLENRLYHKPTELSGGQQQRVAIARALIGNPPIILADEPTGNLDSASGVEVMELFHKLHEMGNTIILITHDSNIAKQASRIIKIMDGKVQE
ncbi:MAG: ABC transporter ATP-binding protein [Clostridia bacterium]|nr:ABC transporter ATP-binding protein [Clostridia bacterium]